MVLSFNTDEASVLKFKLKRRMKRSREGNQEVIGDLAELMGFADSKHDNSDSLSGSSFGTLEQDELRYKDPKHSSVVLSGLNSLRLSGTFCDVTLCVESVEYPCHKSVLCAFSPYFKAMFASDMAECQQNRVVLNGVEVQTLRQLIEYAYTSEIMISRNNVQSLLSAANLLEVLPVRDACCKYLEKYMDETNCLGIHCFAELHACIELQQKAKQFTCRYFYDVMHQEEFLSLSKSKLVEFLTCDEIEVEKEEDIFEGVLLWLNHNPDLRKEGFEKVLEHVRLPLMSPYYIHDRVSSVPAINQSMECCRLVEEAKSYHLLPDRRRECSNARTRPRKTMGLVDVIVSVGGEDDKVVLRCVDCFDINSNRWFSLAVLPNALSKHGTVVTGQNLLYVAGGEYPDGSASRFAWRYDPVLDSWHEIAPMSVARSELGLAILDGYIYAIGGWEGVSRLDSVERYDPSTNRWHFVQTLKIALTSPAVASLHGLLYVTGGAVLEDGDGISLVQCYNPKNDTWTKLTPMLIPRSGSGACVLNDSIYVIGGWHASSENTNKVECYSPQKNSWEAKCQMKERRYRPGVAVIDGKIYVFGGEESWDKYHDSVECYDPDKDTWSLVGSMPTSRSWLSCATIQLPPEIVNEDKIRNDDGSL